MKKIFEQWVISQQTRGKRPKKWINARKTHLEENPQNRVARLFAHLGAIKTALFESLLRQIMVLTEVLKKLAFLVIINWLTWGQNLSIELWNFLLTFVWQPWPTFSSHCVGQQTVWCSGTSYDASPPDGVIRDQMRDSDVFKKGKDAIKHNRKGGRKIPKKLDLSPLDFRRKIATDTGCPKKVF